MGLLVGKQECFRIWAMQFPLHLATYEGDYEVQSCEMKAIAPLTVPQTLFKNK